MIGKRQWLFEQASHGAYPNRGPEHMVFTKNSSSGERCKLTGEYFKEALCLNKKMALCYGILTGEFCIINREFSDLQCLMNTLRTKILVSLTV